MSAKSEIEKVPCPRCNAAIGVECEITPTGKPQKPWHEERAKAKEMADDEAQS